MKRAHGDFEDDEDEDDDLFFDVEPQCIHADQFAFEMDEPLSASLINHVPMLHGVVEKVDRHANIPKFEVQRIVPVRSDKRLLDNVCYYKQQALITLLYGHVTQGVKVRGLFDQDHQCL